MKIDIDPYEQPPIGEEVCISIYRYGTYLGNICLKKGVLTEEQFNDEVNRIFGHEIMKLRHKKEAEEYDKQMLMKKNEPKIKFFSFLKKILINK